MQPVICPHCGGAVGNDARFAGSVVTCPYCRRPFQMPPALQAVPAPTSESPFGPLTVTETEDRPQRLRREAKSRKLAYTLVGLALLVLAGVGVWAATRGRDPGGTASAPQPTAPSSSNEPRGSASAPQPNAPSSVNTNNRAKEQGAERSGETQMTPEIAKLLSEVLDVSSLVAAGASGDQGKAFIALVERNVRVNSAIEKVPQTQRTLAVAELKRKLQALTDAVSANDKVAKMNIEYALGELKK